MKKTFNINISGIIFHIDEDAFNRLNKYLDNLKIHFKNTEGSDEIIDDIESRIAELLKEKISENQQVVTITDIEEVIEIMGEPDDIGEGEEEGDDKDYSENKKGSGSDKRLFRDPENKVIGGVSSGIAAYLNIDPIWIRLFFLLIFFLGGSGVLIYIILWVLIPEAKTAADKLQMKGEKVNIDNIEKNIKEEFEDIKERINNLSDKAKSKYKKKETTGRTFFEKLISLFIDIFRLFGRVIIILVGIALVSIAISLIVAFLVTLFGWGSRIYIDGHEAINLSIPYLSDFLIGAQFDTNIFIMTLTVFIGIPLLMLLYLGIRVIFRIPKTNYVGVSAFSVWLLSLIAVIYYSFTISNYFRYEGEYNKTTELNIENQDTLYLKLNNNIDENITIYNFVETGSEKVVFSDEKQIFYTPELAIQAIDSGKVTLTEERSSRGRSKKHAKLNAKSAKYNYKVNSNAICFNKYLELEKSKAYRWQQSDMLLNVPVGTIVHIDKNLENILDPWYFNDPFDMADKYWIMTKDGLEETK